MKTTRFTQLARMTLDRSTDMMLFVLSVASLWMMVPDAAFAGGARNPIIWADVPDPALIREGDTYYMTSTTMHMCPGVPVMKSKDLVNWEMVGYAYQKLEDNDQTTRSLL
jgi:beta-xylosidase